MSPNYGLESICILMKQFHKKSFASAAQTSVWIHPVGGVVLGVKRVLQVELGVLQHPLDHVLDVNGFGHVWRRHDVERNLTGVGGLGHALDDEVAPQPLLLHRIVTLATSKTTAENRTAKRWNGNS